MIPSDDVLQQSKEKLWPPIYIYAIPLFTYSKRVQPLFAWLDDCFVSPWIAIAIAPCIFAYYVWYDGDCVTVIFVNA